MYSEHQVRLDLIWRLFFFQWRRHPIKSILECQRIYPNRNLQRLKYSVHYRTPYVDASTLMSMTTIVPDCETSVRKRKLSQGAAELAELYQRIFRMWSAALQNNDPDQIGSEACAACLSSDRSPLTCALCLKTYHSSCLATGITAGRGLGGATIAIYTTRRFADCGNRDLSPLPQLPAEFQNDRVLCGVCQEIARIVVSAGSQ